MENLFILEINLRLMNWTVPLIFKDMYVYISIILTDYNVKCIDIKTYFIDTYF